MIKIQDYDKERQKINFTTDMSVNLANAIRRSVMEIPIMAIDEVEIIKNDSALYDEILSHRLGLVPLNTKKSVKEAKFKLKEKGEKTVYSTDIKPSVDTDYNLPLVILEKDQKIEINLYANTGKGIEHVKYSPGFAYYRHNLSPEILDFVQIDNKGKINYDEEDLKDKDLSEEQINEIKKVKSINELFYVIESWGQIDVKEIFPRAIEALNDNLDELNKAIK